MRWYRAAFAVVLSLMAVGCAGAADGSEDATDATGDATESLKAAGFKYGFQSWDHDGTHNDNPVALIFVSNKPDLVDRVYNQVGSVGLTHSGSKMTLSGTGGSRAGVSATDSWTSQSAGRKGAWGCWGKCASGTDIHVRTYGPDGHAGTQVYQGSFGVRPYYLIATIHFDVNENTPTADFGYQDEARSLLIEKMTAKHLWHVIGSVNVQNACSGRVDKTHFCIHPKGDALIVDID